MNYRDYVSNEKNLKRYVILWFILFLVLLCIGCPFLDQLTSLIQVELSTSTGLAIVGDSIQVVEIAPKEAQVAYQWQRSTSENSGFVDISGAVSDTYELLPTDADHYVKVKVTGEGDYKGTVYSSAVEVLSSPRTINIPEITGIEIPVAGNNPVRNIHAEQYFATVAWTPNHTPFRARTSYTATISMIPRYGYTCEGVVEDFFTVEGATSTSNEEDSDIVEATFAQTGNLSLISIAGITGILEIRQTVSAGSLSPGGAKATYRWLISNEIDGDFVAIDGATESNYTIKDEDVDKYLKVEATGTGGYIGKVTSAAAGPIKRIPLTHLGNVSGTPQVGKTLTMGSHWPSSATVMHFWLSSPTIDGEYSEITHSPDDKEFKLTSEEINLYIKGQVEGIGLYEGLKETDPVGPVTAGELESIGSITGKRLVGEVLTAGEIVPLGATVSYQWQHCDTEDGTYENIPGEMAQMSTYVVQDEYWEKFIRVSATGADGYEGTVNSNPVEISFLIGDQTDGGGYIFFDKGVRDNTVGKWELVGGDRDPSWVPDSTTTKEWRYLEVAPAGWGGNTTDPTHQWDSKEYEHVDDIIEVGGLGNLLGAGLQNTNKIINTLGSAAMAAMACSSYNGSGASDWYLGNTTELSYMMSNKPTDHGLTDYFYYSSNEKGTFNAYAVDLFGGYFHNDFDKSNYLCVRPIRMR